MSFMSRGVDELRGGIRSLRQRARSLRFSCSRPRPSPTIHLRLCFNSTSRPWTIQDDLSSTESVQIMQESIMASAISHYSEDPFFGNKDFLTPQSARKKSIANSVSSNPSSGRGPDPCEKRVTFQEKNSGTKGRLIEGVKFLYERSSPIEEWSSDSRDSPLLEMSRYDNVPPCGPLTREHKDRLVSDP